MSLTLFDTFSLAALATMLLIAIGHDTVARRIPNALVLWGAAVALGLSLSPNGIGLGSALAGGMVGFLGFWVFYLLRMVGAGDVKLAALLRQIQGAGVWTRGRRALPASDARPRRRSARRRG